MTIEEIVFAAGLASGTTLLALASAALLTDRFAFWPPPSKTSWQGRVMLLLFRGLVYSALALTALLAWRASGEPTGWFHLVVGGTMLLLGFGAALAGTRTLGWKKAFGDDTGLQTTGVFARSRNPIYVATWLGLTGWGLIALDWRITSLLLTWAAIYMLATRLEEKGLHWRYGSEFADYCTTTPRFVGLRSFTQ